MMIFSSLILYCCIGADWKFTAGSDVIKAEVKPKVTAVAPKKNEPVPVGTLKVFGDNTAKYNTSNAVWNLDLSRPQRLESDSLIITIEPKPKPLPAVPPISGNPYSPTTLPFYPRGIGSFREDCVGGS